MVLPNHMPSSKDVCIQDSHQAGARYSQRRPLLLSRLPSRFVGEKFCPASSSRKGKLLALEPGGETTSILSDCYALTVTVDAWTVTFLSGLRATRWAVFERTAYYTFRSPLLGRRDSFLRGLLVDCEILLRLRACASGSLSEFGTSDRAGSLPNWTRKRGSRVEPRFSRQPRRYAPRHHACSRQRRERRTSCMMHASTCMLSRAHLSCDSHAQRARAAQHA